MKLAETPLFDTSEIEQFMAAVKRELKKKNTLLSSKVFTRFNLALQNTVPALYCRFKKRGRKKPTTQGSAFDLSQHLLWWNGKLWLLVN